MLKAQHNLGGVEDVNNNDKLKIDLFDFRTICSIKHTAQY